MTEHPDHYRALLIVTGGIAVYRACELVRELRRSGAEVRVVMTRSATEFVAPMTFEALSGRKVHTDQFPGVTDGVIDHIALGREAEVVLVAPATADFLARAHAGMADDLALSTLLALRPEVKVLYVPAMNVEMWNHPATRRNLQGLREMGEGRFFFMQPVEKELACGEVGAGGFPEPVDIAAAAIDVVRGQG